MRTAIRFVLLFLTITALHAQTQVRQPRFALEISEDGYPPHFVIVPEGQQGGGIDSMFFGPSLHPLLRHNAGNSEKTQPSAVKLECKVDGDAVAITATAVFGAFDKTDTSLSQQGHPQQRIGTYSQHLNESIVLREMEVFGLQAWTIKIVNAQLPTPISLATVNEVPSIQPEILGKDREGYRMALHNLSSRAVTAFLVETSFDHNSNYTESSDHSVLIAPGANHEFRLFCDTSASVTSNGIAPEPAPCAFNLKAALFADGSYEGDASAAASMESARLTKASQSHRIQLMVQSILADSTIEESSRISQIRLELTKMSAQPDPAIPEQLRLKFPGLSPSEWSSVSADMKTELALQERLTLGALQEFETSSKSASSTQSLAQWWSAWERTQ